MRPWSRRLLPVLASVLVLAALAMPAPARAADVEFLSTSLQASPSGPTHYKTTFRSTERPIRVEVVSRVAGFDGFNVTEADVTRASGTYTAQGLIGGVYLPNTKLSYRFRVVTSSGVVLGPEKTHTYADDLVTWQTIDGQFMRLHWHEGDRRFAGRALKIGDDAVARISELLGVTESEPIDFFVYSDQELFQAAMGPGTREYVAGRAIPQTRTLFALIEPSEVGSDWVDVVIPHELTHLIFDTATSNPYHHPPHWLDEGIAVYLSDGYTEGWRSTVEVAVRERRLVPLSGLAAKFPPGQQRFRLGYAEGVSAVDYFIRRFDEPTLVKLIRSYAEGRTDDEAFEAATGIDFAAFDAAWQADVAGSALREYGPQPGQPGPRPTGWEAPRPTESPRVPPPETDPPSGPSPATPGTGASGPLLALLVAVLVVGALGAVLVMGARRRAAREARSGAGGPPGAWPPGPPGAPGSSPPPSSSPPPPPSWGPPSLPEP